MISAITTDKAVEAFLMERVIDGKNYYVERGVIYYRDSGWPAKYLTNELDSWMAGIAWAISHE